MQPQSVITKKLARLPLSLFEAIFLALIKQVGLCAAEVDDFRTAISIFLLLGAFFTIVGIRDAGTTADDTAPLEGPIIALVTHTNQRAGPHIRVADHTLAIALLAQAPDCYSRLLPAHDQVWMMLGHGELSCSTTQGERCSDGRYGQ